MDILLWKGRDFLEMFCKPFIPLMGLGTHFLNHKMVLEPNNIVSHLNFFLLTPEYKEDLLLNIK
jgi:hypothetical protein